MDEPRIYLNIGSQALFYLYSGKGWLWFRFWDKWGLSIKDTRKANLLFSERNRLRGYRVGPYSISALR